MRIHEITAFLLLIAAIFFAGCSTDPTGVVLDTDSIMGSVEDTIGGALSEVGETTQTIGGESPVDSTTPQSTPASSGNWVFWREEQLSPESGYSQIVPSVNTIMQKHLKLEVKTEAPVTIRFMTLEEAHAYTRAWDENPSFDRNTLSYIESYTGISDGAIEAHANEGIAFVIEPYGQQKRLSTEGTVRIYYH
ncbi:hypothetical protein [Methanocalculus sp.]|uniref:hypothetical protein n=1 Tax=Methanocalculus sp. TaxID=2004547 RepID=UPI002628A209|nr:hypothetical protein [Methanocalculus sp.]MDG6250553.1 hypothetical protein [Methanocalculus sp.]